MNILFIHIKELLQTRDKSEVKMMGKSMSELPHIKNAFLRIKGDTIHSYGSMSSLVIKATDKVIDITGKIILPTWCDSHSHVVYARLCRSSTLFWVASRAVLRRGTSMCLRPE